MLGDVEPVVAGARSRTRPGCEIVRDLGERDARGREIRDRGRGGRGGGGRGRDGCGGGHRRIGRRGVAVVVVATARDERSSPRRRARAESSVLTRGASAENTARSGLRCRAMKYVVFVPDGCADVPLAELGDKTPLEAARDAAPRRARRHAERSAAPPSSRRDCRPAATSGNMAILGFDPARYHTGRAPIEAAAMGVELAPDEVAYRCNLVTLSSEPIPDDGRLRGRTSRRTRRVIRSSPRSTRRLGDGRDGVRFHRGCRVPPLVRRAEGLGRSRVHATARPHRARRRVPDRTRRRRRCAR